ncbi:MAG: hypothetical protein Q9160_007677 [Pyrenula sp. 1 TL-2023]
MNVVDLTGEQSDQLSVMPDAEEAPRVNFPQAKYSVTYYAGLYTPLLEKQYFAWVDDGKHHDNFCVVCLKPLKSNKDVLRCGTSSRSYHHQCLFEVECVLCLKRLWDDEPPFKPTAGILGRNDDNQVKLWRRHMKWNERMKGKEYSGFSRWVTFYDDGSLTSDRFLLKLMDITPANKFKGWKALKEQAENSEVYRQWITSHKIRQYEDEISVRTDTLKDLRSKWNSTAVGPYFEAQEDSITALRDVVEYTRRKNGLEAPNMPQTKTKKLQEAEAKIKKLEADLARVQSQASNDLPESSARVGDGGAVPEQLVAGEKKFVDSDQVASVLSLSLETPANRPIALPGLLTKAGVSQSHVHHLMQLPAFKEVDEKYRKKLQFRATPTIEIVRTPLLEPRGSVEAANGPSSPVSKRRTRAEAARDDARVMKKERVD